MHRGCTECHAKDISPNILLKDKLKVDPDKIKVTAKDFMLSVKKMVPSSERSTSSGAAPLPKLIEPLLREQLKEIENIVDGLIPIKKKTTALQEAMYEQYEDNDHGFGRETCSRNSRSHGSSALDCSSAVSMAWVKATSVEAY